MAYCVKCGAELGSGAGFCFACGARQDGGGEQQAPACGAAPQGEYSYDAGPSPADSWELEPQKKKGHSGKTMLIVLSAAAAVVVLALIGVGVLAVVSGADMSRRMVSLVQGNLDEIYLGRYNDDFMEMTGSSQAECEQIYLDGLEQEVDYFLYYWNIEYPTEALKDELTGLYKEIYGRARYTVGECSRLDENTYAIKLDIYPIDIMQRVSDAIDIGGMDWFYEKYPSDAAESMTQEEYEAWDQDWARGIVDLVRGELPSLNYMEAKSRAVQVVRNEDGHWTLDNGDLGWIDTWMIYYP